MLFYVLMIIAIIAIPLAAGFGYFADRESRFPEPMLSSILGGTVGFIISLIPGLIVLSTWHAHASDISKVVAQEHRIEVQEERIVSLTERLDRFNYPVKPTISLDADHPWASIVESLTNAENQLANAKDERAIAIRSIEARKRGPMSGVISFVGDYK